MSTLDEEWEQMRDKAQAVLDGSKDPRVAVPVLIPTTKQST